MDNNQMQYTDRREVERVLLSEVINRGDLSPLISQGIDHTFFDVHGKKAEYIWKQQSESGYVPSKKVIKTMFPKFDATSAETEAEVKEAVYFAKRFRARDLLNKELLELKPLLREDNPDGWLDILKNWPEKFFKIQNVMNSTGAKDFALDSEDRYQYVQKRANEQKDGNWRVNFAHKEMNEHFGGYEPGFYLYVARTGRGKTWTCLLDLWWTWYHGRLLDEPVNVGLFSLEMDEHKTGLRLDTFESNFSNYDLNRGIIRRKKDIEDEVTLEKEASDYLSYIEKIKDESERGERGKFKIWTQNMFNGPITPKRIEALIKEEGLDFVVVDQLELVDADSGVTDERVRLNEVSRELKKMSGRLNIPILVPHQMNRETVKVKEVTDANVAGSDGPARHAEFVCYLDKDKESNVMIYNFLKSRNAPIDKKFALAWDWDTGVYHSFNPDYKVIQDFEERAAEEDEQDKLMEEEKW